MSPNVCGCVVFPQKKTVKLMVFSAAKTKILSTVVCQVFNGKKNEYPDPLCPLSVC